MDSKSRCKYEAPTLTVITFSVERGFDFSVAQSLGFEAEVYGNKEVESRNEVGNWGGTDGFF